VGFINFVNNFFDSLRDFASNYTEFKCSQCIKCKQCIKTLSNGKQVRIFTCPAVDDGVYNDEYIDSVLPASPQITTDYLEAYQKNRDAIYRYLYNTGALYQDTAKPISKEDATPILKFNELQYCYKAMECSMFRGFINSDNILTDNDTLITSPIPDLTSFDDLSKEDKIIITQQYNWE